MLFWKKKKSRKNTYKNNVFPRYVDKMAGEFDVEKFKEIAKARLLRKYYRVEREVMHKIRLMIDNNFNSIDIFKYYDAIDSRTESYDKKIKELRCN